MTTRAFSVRLSISTRAIFTRLSIALGAILTWWAFTTWTVRTWLTGVRKHLGYVMLGLSLGFRRSGRFFFSQPDDFFQARFQAA
jgi:hypothetical protein